MKPLVAAVAAVAAVAVATTWVLTGTPPPQIEDPTRLELSVPATITAGEELWVEITSDPGVAVAVHLVNGYSATTHHLTLAEGSGRLAVAATRFAGRLDVLAVAGSLRATATTSILAREDLDLAVPLVGARSIVADGVDRAMVVVIPSDRYGNPAPAGTPVQFTVQHPDRSLATFPVKVDQTVAWSWIPSSTTAGTATVTATAQGRSGPARSLVEIPGEPIDFSLVSETELRPADGATLVSVATEPLIDRHGNRIVDGTAALVHAVYPGGLESQQTAVISGGIARTFLEAPDRPGTVRVWMTVLATTSAPLDLTFSAPLTSAGQR
jgi:hypothetical protein